ncbi:MAG: flavin reductase family protein [Leptolyngbya sp. SIO3F4]|nr:flavin reductase family protein [Leptolyngbya sp. SIO3F4]
MIQVDPRDIETPKLHGYLLGAVGPRPIAFASTMDAEGRPNLSPFSFFNVFSANPPIAIFSPARRGRDNTTKHTYQNVKATGEVVINVVNYSIVEQMSLSSTEYPDGVNEFVKAGLTPVPSERVKPFRVQESPVQLECKVREVIELGDQGGAGNLVVSEIVLMHIDERILNERGSIDPFKIDLVGRMGGNWYCRAQGDALFEIAKPLRSLGIGVDAIPEDIRHSDILTGNNLGQLGNVEQLPNETDVNDFKLTELSDLFLEYADDAPELERVLHRKAQAFLSEGQVEEAWKTLLSFNDR